jgi:hypothetical protein
MFSLRINKKEKAIEILVQDTVWGMYRPQTNVCLEVKTPGKRINSTIRNVRNLAFDFLRLEHASRGNKNFFKFAKDLYEEEYGEKYNPKGPIATKIRKYFNKLV